MPVLGSVDCCLFIYSETEPTTGRVQTPTGDSKGVIMDKKDKFRLVDADNKDTNTIHRYTEPPYRISISWES